MAFMVIIFFATMDIAPVSFSPIQKADTKIKVATVELPSQDTMASFPVVYPQMIIAAIARIAAKNIWFVSTVSRITPIKIPRMETPMSVTGPKGATTIPNPKIISTAIRSMI